MFFPCKQTSKCIIIIMFCFLPLPSAHIIISLLYFQLGKAKKKEKKRRWDDVVERERPREGRREGIKDGPDEDPNKSCENEFAF